MVNEALNTPQNWFSSLWIELDRTIVQNQIIEKEKAFFVLHSNRKILTMKNEKKVAKEEVKEIPTFCLIFLN